MKNTMICEKEARVTSTAGLMFMVTEIMREQYDAKSRKASEKTPGVEIKDKKLLGVEEAAELFGIGIGKLRELTNQDNCPFVLFIGSHRKIKKDAFEQYIMKQYSI